MIKRILKAVTPKPALSAYHYTLARLAAILYRHPSRKLTVIGITGTKGKSTSASLTAQLLHKTGLKVGITSTVAFQVGDREWLNDKKMTMLGRFQTQKLLREMVKAECTHAVIETSSEGIAQFRHIGIDYDIVVFTNLFPEHIESHGSYENYRATKEKLFARLSKTKKKTGVQKIIIANIDDQEAERFLQYPADRKITFGTDESADLRLSDIRVTKTRTSFSINGEETYVPLIGSFNAYNCITAVAACYAASIPLDQLYPLTQKLKPVPGRQEIVKTISEATVMVDYAYEPNSQEKIYDLLNEIGYTNIIHVTGSAGGGRDADRRYKLGKLSGERAKYVIVTNEDPYDEDPKKIIEAVAKGARAAGMNDDESLFVIEDRREAIRKALTLATKGDLVLITGKGAEQAICVANGKKIPWDDRTVANEEAAKL